MFFIIIYKLINKERKNTWQGHKRKKKRSKDRSPNKRQHSKAQNATTRSLKKSKSNNLGLKPIIGGSTKQVCKEMNEKLEKTPSLEVASPYLLCNEKQVMQGDEPKKKPERTPSLEETSPYLLSFPLGSFPCAIGQFDKYQKRISYYDQKCM
jgi:hypothetical protein